MPDIKISMTSKWEDPSLLDIYNHLKSENTVITKKLLQILITGYKQYLLRGLIKLGHQDQNIL